MSVWRCSHAVHSGGAIVRCRSKRRPNAAFCLYHQPIELPPATVPRRARPPSTPELRQALGERIRARRTQLNLTMRRLALLLSADPANIPRWEDGRSAPKALHLIKLAQVLGVSADWLLGTDV